MNEGLNFKRILKDYMNKSEEKSQANDTVEEDSPEVNDKQKNAENYQQLEIHELTELLHQRDADIKKLRDELAKAKDARLRNAAELENYRKRVQRERSKIYDTAKARALEDFLSISDDLKRTLEAAEDLDVNETFLDGVTLVANKFDETLKEKGVRRIDEKGVPFNVDLHDALMRKKPEDEGVESDTVLEIVENGYKIGDRTVRHAKVIVSE